MAFRFGSFEVQPHQRRLLVDGRAVAIGSRAFDVLVVLAERAGELVSKSELFDVVWPDTVVEENNLQVQISALRKLLGPQVIATIPGRGYRLTVAPQEKLVEAAPAAPAPGAMREEATSPRPAAATQRSVASASDAANEMLVLFGRDEDVAALGDLVRQERLVTIVGPAGIGKTRLAQTVVHRLRHEFANGVRVADLAPLAQRDLVVPTVARALGVVLGQAKAALDVLVHAVADQHLLLVLDNCEHLLHEVDNVVTALRKGAPTIHILSTSQESLRHPDEHVYRLGPLGLPAELTVGRASEAGATKLFVARVQAAEARFRLTDQNIDAVVEVCRRLDGIPLAIELAAARAPLLGVEGLRQRLDERFRFLTAGSRLALRRHQTLLAALEWSYGLLSTNEQAVFEKLGVFAGSFSLESAQRLAVDETTDEWAVLDHLGALVDKSLVSVDFGPTARYRLLETTRAFALERLAARGATAHTMRRHAEVMLELFERFYDEMWAGKPPDQGVEALAPDLDNLRAALRWASDANGDRQLAVALIGAAASGGYLHFAGLNAEAWQWCEALRAFVDESIPKAIAARFWHASADQGGYFSPAVSIKDGKRAVVLYDELGDGIRRYIARATLSYPLMQMGDLDSARDVLEEARTLRDPAFGPRLLGLFDNHAALVLSAIGDVPEARAHALEFLAAAREVASAVDEMMALSILVDLEVATGEGFAVAAAEMLARYTACPQAHHAVGGLGLRSLANALVMADRLDEAEAMYRESASLLRRSQGTAAAALYDAALLIARRGRLDDAARVFAYADAVYAARGTRPRPAALRMKNGLLALLTPLRDREAMARLFDEGRRLNESDACAMAFPPPTSRTQAQALPPVAGSTPRTTEARHRGAQ